MAKTARQTGLTAQGVLAARHINGWNELPVVAQSGPFRVLRRQFSGFLVLILIVAAVVAFALGERVDAITIGLVVLLNPGLGFVQGWKAETALASLRKMLSPQAMVLRDEQEQIIPARDIVPGDILVLAPGAKVAADGAIIQAAERRVDESVLTGESFPTEVGGFNQFVESGDRAVVVCCDGSRRVARRCDNHTCAGGHCNGAPKRSGATGASGRNTRRSFGDLYGQDGDTDREQNDRNKDLDDGPHL